jgi:hypothetical protein
VGAMCGLLEACGGWNEAFWSGYDEGPHRSEGLCHGTWIGVSLPEGCEQITHEMFAHYGTLDLDVLHR